MTDDCLLGMRWQGQLFIDTALIIPENIHGNSGRTYVYWNGSCGKKGCPQHYIILMISWLREAPLKGVSRGADIIAGNLLEAKGYR